MRDHAYYNGVFTPYDCATVPLSDRAIFFADAVYDVMIGRNGKAYQIDEHLSRLFANADAIGLENYMSENEMKDEIYQLLKVADADTFILYVQLSAKERRRTHARWESGANLLMTVTSADVPEELLSTAAITLPDLRHGYCNIKTTNLLPSVFSVCDAQMMECESAIFVKGEAVTEASSSNVSLLIGNTLVTHPLDSSILPGISERNLISAAIKHGIRHERREFSLAEMKAADAVLLTSTTKLVKICRSIDGIDLNIKGWETAKLLFGEMLTDLLVKTS